MQTCRAVLQAPVGVGLGRPGAVRAPARSAPTLQRFRLVDAPGTGLVQQRTPGGQPRQRQLSVAAAAKAGGAAGAGGGGDGRSRKKQAPKPQPELQAWLERQGLGAADADKYARRMAAVFGGDQPQQAALGSLPATFAFCGSKGLSGLQTAQLLDRIAETQHGNVVSFEATAQQDWQLIEARIAANMRQLQQAGRRLPKHTSLAALLRDTEDAPRMLAHPPGHVAAWLAAISAQLPEAADVGRLLLSAPQSLNARPSTPAAVLRWCIEELGVQPGEVGALLAHDLQSLQRNLAGLQAALPPELALRLVQKQPSLLTSSSETVREALQWLQQQFGGNAERLHAVLERSPNLIKCSTANLQRRADYLQRQQGWQPGDGQLAAWVEANPLPLATVNFESADKQALLLLYSGVLGIGLADCLGQYSAYLGHSLETIAARYMLVQERAPGLLYGRDGGPTLTWVIRASEQLLACGAATKEELKEFERSWPESTQGQRLLLALRTGSTEGWPRPPPPEGAR